MRELKGHELDAVLDERPALRQELTNRAIVDVYHLNEPNAATTPDADRTGKRVLLLLARRPGQDYLIMSTKGKPDKVVTWVHTGAALPAPDEGQYILIDKSKVGRPRRELTDAERQEIRARHKGGESINQIAKELHIGTRRVMEALKNE